MVFSQVKIVSTKCKVDANMSNDRIAEKTMAIEIAVDDILEIVREIEIDSPEKAINIKSMCSDIQKENRKLTAFIQE
jgi:hypothetical protein